MADMQRSCIRVCVGPSPEPIALDRPMTRSHYSTLQALRSADLTVLGVRPVRHASMRMGALAFEAHAYWALYIKMCVNVPVP